MTNTTHNTLAALTANKVMKMNKTQIGAIAGYSVAFIDPSEIPFRPKTKQETTKFFIELFKKLNKEQLSKVREFINMFPVAK